MTKQDFLDGKSFRTLKNNKIGNSSYLNVGSESRLYSNLIKEIRHSKTDKVVLQDYHLNISKITDSFFTGFVFVVDKEVKVRYYFKDLVVID